MEEVVLSFLRKIIYLNEYTGNVCGGNAGYVKLSQKETRLKIEIRLTGNTYLKGQKIYLLERDKSAVNKRFVGVVPTDEKIIHISKEINEIGKIKGSIIGIILGGDGTGMCAGSDDNTLNISNYIREESAAAPEAVQGKEELLAKPETQNSDEVEMKESILPETEEQKHEEPAAEEPASEEMEAVAAEEEEIIQVEIEEPHDEAYEFEKIFSSRPNMYPFEDDEMEACVQISPADFSDFPKEFWKMGSNSFLLQGYYNYRHLILAKANGKLYLGIPGQYHRRDKYLADMFGFGRFKGIRRKQEKLGDFGYWMMEIEVPRSADDELCCRSDFI